MGVIEKQSIQDIADAIRDRNGLTTLYKPRQMDEAIRGLYKTEAVNHVFDNLTVSTTKEGTSFTLDDAEGEAEITELKGNTTQEGTPTPSNPIEVKTVSGDNEVVVSNEQHVTGNSYRVDLGGKNLWSLSNTYTNDTSSAKYVLSDTTVSIPPGTYTFSWKFSQGTVGSLNYKYADNTNHLTNISSSYTFTFTEEVKKVAIYLGGNTTVTDIQLEKGSQATPYSPYTSNPIELCKIGNYRDGIKRSKGKNLFNGTYTNAYIGESTGDEFTLNNSTRTAILEVEPNTTYTISKYVDTGIGTRFYVYEYPTLLTAQTDMSRDRRLFAGNQATSTIVTTSSTGNYLYVYVTNDVSSIPYLMIEKGSNENPSYEPYGVGIWYIEKNIGKANMEDYNWTKYGTNIENISRFATTGIPNVKYVANNRQLGDALSNYYQNHTGSGMSGVAYYFCIDTNMVQATDDTTLTKPRGVLYYALATPTYTEITDSYLLEQLNGLLDIQLYDNLCYVDWVGTEKPTMKLTYYVDTDKILEKLREE